MGQTPYPIEFCGRLEGVNIGIGIDGKPEVTLAFVAVESPLDISAFAEYVRNHWQVVLKLRRKLESVGDPG